MLTSARRGIVYPNTTRVDSADVPRDFAAVVAALELDVVYGQGTFAARPVSTPGSPGMQGRIYMATDLTPHVMYYDYGTGWDPVGAVSAGSIGTTELANGSVTNAKLAASAASLEGTLAARPAASSVVAGTFYHDTSNNVVYRSDGAAWTTVAIHADGSGNVSIAGNYRAESGAFRIHRHPYGNERHIESGIVVTTNSAHIVVSFTNAFAANPSVVVTGVIPYAGAFVCTVDSVSTTSVRVIQNSGANQTMNWIAEGQD